MTDLISLKENKPFPCKNLHILCFISKLSAPFFKVDIHQNPKRFWSFVKSKKASPSVSSFTNNNETITDPAEIASVFASHFQDNFTVDQSVFDPNDMIDTCHGHPGMLLFCSMCTDGAEVSEILSKLNISKSPGPDGISSRLLKLASPAVANTLAKIFNISIESGTFPEDWKKANVVPIYKKGAKDDFRNYRPVSLCSTVGKIMERIVAKRLQLHLRMHGLVAEGQHGFCQGRSCATQLVTMYHDWSSILDQQPSPRIDAVFLDWSKAFDKVSHSLLLSKLHGYGICGQMLKWFASYLYGRIQRVQYSGKFSDWITVKSGVPQGSILGPLLFNIHVLDLPSFVSSAIPQYADDTVLYRPIYSVQDEVNLQTDLDAIRTWSTINKLPLNAAKCVVMHITRSRRPILVSYRMGDTSLETITTHKHLGIVLSSNLEWGPHVDEVTSKAKRLLGFIRRTVGSNDPATMKKLFVALVRPIIEYCAPLWTPNKESHKHKLEGVQRSFTRYCFPGPWHSRPSYDTRLQILDIPTTISRFDYLRTMFVVGCLWGKYDISWEDYIKVNTSNSRQAVNVDFRHFRSRTDAFHNSLFVSFPRIWSTLPDDVSSEIVLNLFSFSRSLRRCVYIYH